MKTVPFGIMFIKYIHVHVYTCKLKVTYGDMFIYLNNKMLSLVINVGYEGGDVFLQ